MKNRATRWLLPFAVLGASATVRAAFSLFATTGRRPREMWTDGSAPVDSEDFLEPLAADFSVAFVVVGLLSALTALAMLRLPSDAGGEITGRQAQAEASRAPSI